MVSGHKVKASWPMTSPLTLSTDTCYELFMRFVHRNSELSSHIVVSLGKIACCSSFDQFGGSACFCILLMWSLMNYNRFFAVSWKPLLCYWTWMRLDALLCPLFSASGCCWNLLGLLLFFVFFGPKWIVCSQLLVAYALHFGPFVSFSFCGIWIILALVIALLSLLLDSISSHPLGLLGCWLVFDVYWILPFTGLCVTSLLALWQPQACGVVFLVYDEGHLWQGLFETISLALSLFMLSVPVGLCFQLWYWVWRSVIQPDFLNMFSPGSDYGWPLPVVCCRQNSVTLCWMIMSWVVVASSFELWQPPPPFFPLWTHDVSIFALCFAEVPFSSTSRLSSLWESCSSQLRLSAFDCVVFFLCLYMVSGCKVNQLQLMASPLPSAFSSITLCFSWTILLVPVLSVFLVPFGSFGHGSVCFQSLSCLLFGLAALQNEGNPMVTWFSLSCWSACFLDHSPILQQDNFTYCLWQRTTLFYTIFCHILAGIKLIFFQDTFECSSASGMLVFSSWCRLWVMFFWFFFYLICLLPPSEKLLQGLFADHLLQQTTPFSRFFFCLLDCNVVVSLWITRDCNNVFCMFFISSRGDMYVIFRFIPAHFIVFSRVLRTVVKRYDLHFIFLLLSLSMVRGHKAQALWPVASPLNLLSGQHFNWIVNHMVWTILFLYLVYDHHGLLINSPCGWYLFSYLSLLNLPFRLRMELRQFEDLQHDANLRHMFSNDSFESLCTFLENFHPIFYL